MSSTSAGTVPRTYRDAHRALASNQKTSKGAPAYSRYVNRAMGRRFAALAYVAGMTPNQVTAVSALLTYSGIALVAFAAPTVPVSIAISLLLLVGYSLDSADGQLARLRGGGSAAGEWLDHVVDAIKIGLLHVAVLLFWYRHYDIDDRLLLIPLGYLVVQTVFFFATMLTDSLRRSHRGITRNILAGEGSSSLAYSLMVLPTDYGVLCMVFALLWWQAGFVVLYGLFALAATGFLLLALPKWYLEMRRLAPAPAAAAPAPPVG